MHGRVWNHLDIVVEIGGREGGREGERQTEEGREGGGEREKGIEGEEERERQTERERHRERTIDSLCKQFSDVLHNTHTNISSITSNISY